MTYEAQSSSVSEKPIEEKSSESSVQSKGFTIEDVEKIKREKEDLEKRLSNKDIENYRKSEGLKKRIEELEKKERAGTATTEEGMELSAGRQASTQAESQGMTHDQAEAMVQERMKSAEFGQKIDKAAASDPEFKALLEDPKHRGKFNADHEYALRDVPNAPAVLKKLLSDPREMALMQAKYNDAFKYGSSLFVDYINQLSERLEKSSTRPRASSYTQIPDISDFGDSGQDFDIKNFVSKHR